MRSRLQRVVWALQTIAVFLTAALSGQGQQPILTITDPAAESYLAGPVALRVALRSESPSKVRRVDFFVDGTLACQALLEPFECNWDAGATVKARIIRAAATLENGERLVATLRTRALDLNERVTVDSVLVPVVVTDGRGRFIQGLKQAAFQVKEDGKPKAITFFQAEDVALDIAVAVDVSESVRAILPQVKLAARRFVDALRPADKLTMLAFNERVFVLTRQDTSLATRAQGLERLNAFGRTSLRDAIISSLDLLSGDVSRRAVVVFTDGEDTQSMASIDAVESRLRESDAALYIITQGAAAEASSMQRQMQRLATLSGGRTFRLRQISELQTVFDSILNELGHQYLLGYSRDSAAPTGKYHKLRVELSGQRGSVRARDGYWSVP